MKVQRQKATYLEKIFMKEVRKETRNWEDNNGVKRYTTEVVCEQFTMLGRKMESNNSPSQPINQQNSGPSTEEIDDDLPF